MDLTRLTAKLARSVKTVDDLAGAAEAIGLAVVARAASWGASVPNTVLVARSASEVFRLGWGLSLAIAISLELIGHALVSHWQDARHWNDTKRKVDQPANVALALGLTIAYWVLDFVMVGVLALSTWASTSDWRIFIALCYPLIGVAVAIVTNERAHLFRLKQAVERERQEKREKRQSRRERPRQQAVTLPPTYTTIGADTRERARAILAERPSISGSELGRQLGKSPSLGRKLKRELVAVPSGKSDNGHGQNDGL
jgi:hypothetical protein